MDLGDNIKTIRKLKKLSQEDLANKIGVQKQHISGWETNKYQPNKENLDKLATALGVKLTDLYNYSEEKHTSVSDIALTYEAVQKNREVVAIRVVEAKAQAGYLRGYADPEYMDTLPQIYVSREFERGGNYVAFTVNGDSMDDGTKRSLCQGDVVVGKELQKHYWSSKLHFNRVLFIIVHRDGVLFKQITAHDVATGEITCHSFNPHYEDFTLNLKEVSQLFYIKKIAERNINF